MKLIDLLLEQPSEKEKQRFLKKSLLIYGIFRKRTYNNYGYKFSWVLSNDVEIKYKYDNESFAVIYPKDIQIKLHNDMVIRDYEVGDVKKKDFPFIISSYLNPYNIKINIKDENIHITKDEEDNN